MPLINEKKVFIVLPADIKKYQSDYYKKTSEAEKKERLLKKKLRNQLKANVFLACQLYAKRSKPFRKFLELKGIEL